jgi:hypothetical protein
MGGERRMKKALSQNDPAWYNRQWMMMDPILVSSDMLI